MESVSKTLKITVTPRFISKPVPEEELENFNNWLFWTGLEYGVGNNSDYYDYTDNYKEAIKVDFTVTFNTLPND